VFGVFGEEVEECFPAEALEIDRLSFGLGEEPLRIRMWCCLALALEARGRVAWAERVLS